MRRPTTRKRNQLMSDGICTRPTRLFNIRPGESPLVGLLLVHSALVGCARIFTRTSAYALFLARFDAQALPYVYVAMGLVVTLLSFVYLRLSRRLSFSRLLMASVAFLLLTLLGFRLGLGLTAAPWLTFALPVWYEVLFTLTNLEFWNLAGRLFTVRQGKRLFGLVTAGEQAAVLLGGLLVPLLVARIATADLLTLAAVAVALILALLVPITRLYGNLLAAPAEASAAEGQESCWQILQNRYVLLIIGTFAASMVSYFVIDNVFYAQAEGQYAGEEQLAGFIGLFFGLAGFLGFLCRTFFTGQLLRRYGVRAGLLLQPVLLILMAVPAALAGGLGLLAALFWLVASLRLTSAVLVDSLDLPTLNITYQPLPAGQRVPVQTMTEGIVYSLAIGAAGATLSISTRLLPPGSMGFVVILLALLLAWAVLAGLLGREYPRRLLQALRRRSLGPTRLLLADDAGSLGLLHRELSSPHLGVVLYAMDTLEAIKPGALLPALPALLEHPLPEVRGDVLLRLERHGWTLALAAVRERVAAESSPAVRGAAVRTLAVLGGASAVDEVAGYLAGPEPQVRRGALVGLLRGGASAGALLAGGELRQMSGSPQAAERALAAQVLGEVGRSTYVPLLVRLLQDPDAGVQRAALLAAGQIPDERLCPLLLERLDSPYLWRAAAASLVAAGEPVVARLGAAAAGSGLAPLAWARLVDIAGRVGGEQAIVWLKTLALDPAHEPPSPPDARLRSRVLHALHRCGYRAQPGETALVQRQIEAEAARSAATLATLADLGDGEAVHLLRLALAETLAQDRDRLFYLLSFLYDGQAIQRARDTLALPSARKQAYARELLDLLLPQSLKRMVFPLLADLPPEQKVQQLQALFPQPRRDRFQRLGEVLDGPPGRFGAWTQVCALYAAGCLAALPLRGVVARGLTVADPLIRETSLWALSRLGGDGLRDRLGVLGHDADLQVACLARWLATGRHEEERMLTTVEKVLALKKVDVFAATPDETLAAVAGLLEEVPLSAGQAVFEKGDLGECLYLVVDGEVRVHDGENTLSYLGEGDVFGEMALLDAEPRMASVTAAADTLLLRLASEPFFELMDDRPEVARGIIRVLSRRLRARSQGQEVRR